MKMSEFYSKIENPSFLFLLLPFKTTILDNLLQKKLKDLIKF